METQVDWGPTNSTTHHEQEPPPAYDDVTGSPQQLTQQLQQPEEQPQVGFDWQKMLNLFLPKNKNIFSKVCTSVWMLIKLIVVVAVLYLGPASCAMSYQKGKLTKRTHLLWNLVKKINKFKKV